MIQSPPLIDPIWGIHRVVEEDEDDEMGDVSVVTEHFYHA